MKIFTNCVQLRLAGDYLNNINIEFLYSASNVFNLAQYAPDLILTKDVDEATQASREYPSIKFVGPGFSFPNYHVDIPNGLLDELSVLSGRKEYQFCNCDISYFNTEKNQNFIFVKKLQSLGNTKIIGDGYSIDQCIKNYPKRLSPAFYKFGKYGAATDLEEAYKILFMNKPCLVNADLDYCYNTYKLDSEKELNLTVKDGQVEYAWSMSHTLFLSNVLASTGYQDKANELKEIINLNHKGTK